MKIYTIKNYRTLIAGFVFALVIASAGFAQKANVVYVEGTSQIKSSSGSLRLADFGGAVAYGESVITGKNGMVELKLDNGSTIRVTPNSVFSYSSTGTGTNTRSVLATTAGSVSYKLNKAVGKPPVIQTNSMVAGVRGTEFTVYAGRDGSVLLAVTEGIVDVDAQGKTVALYKDEAVEVEPGKAPGPKYIWLGKEVDFSSWNQNKNDDFLTDPVAGIDAVAFMLAEYQKELNALKGPYEEATKKWKAASDGYAAVVEAGDQAKLTKYKEEILFPAQEARSVLILNIRYHALNYLSVRRFVLSNLYMEMKSRYPLNQTEESKKFFAKHAELLTKYEAGIVPTLNSNDY